MYAINAKCVCVSTSVPKSIHLTFMSLSLSRFSRGIELSHTTLSNEAMHQRGKHPLAMDVYLQYVQLHKPQAVHSGCFRFLGWFKQYLFWTHRRAVLMSSFHRTSVASITWIHVSIKQVCVRRSISVSHYMARLPV